LLLLLLYGVVAVVVVVVVVVVGGGGGCCFLSALSYFKISDPAVQRVLLSVMGQRAAGRWLGTYFN
jgi:hypothetical protein